MYGYFPVHCIGLKPQNPFCIKLAIGKVDLPKPKPVTRTAKMGGHEWKKGPKGLKCAVGHATAPLYKSLSEIEVAVVFPCQGSVPAAGIHFTHQMGSGRVSFCEFCRGRHRFGASVSRKLSLPCGTSARAMCRLGR